MGTHSSFFLPGKSHGQKSLACCSPWDHKELDMTYRLENSKCLRRASSFADRKVMDRPHHPAHPLWWKGCGSVGSKVACDAAGSGRHKILLRVSGGECASNEGRLSEVGDISKIYFNCFQNVQNKYTIFKKSTEQWQGYIIQQENGFRNNQDIITRVFWRFFSGKV